MSIQQTKLTNNEIGGPDYSQPKFFHLIKISWSIMWRYMAFGVVMGLIFLPFYFLHAGFVVSILHNVKMLEEASLESGYMAALTLRPGLILFWVAARLFIGYVVTYWIFSQIIMRSYADFSVGMQTPTPQASLSPHLHVYKKGLHYISWAFYWRFSLLFMLLFVISLMIIKPEWMVIYFWEILLMYVFLTFVLTPVVLRWIVNKPLGHQKQYCMWYRS